MEYVGRAYRTSTIRAHPTKRGYTIIEQAGGVEVNTNVPGALRGPIENFACGYENFACGRVVPIVVCYCALTLLVNRAFIDVCKQALNKLNVTLHHLTLKNSGPTLTESIPAEEEAASSSTSTSSGESACRPSTPAAAPTDRVLSAASGTLHGIGLVLGGLCCKVLLAGSWRSSTLRTDANERVPKAADAAVAAADARSALSSRPMLSRQTPPFRAAAAAFAVALVSTQLL